MPAMTVVVVVMIMIVHSKYPFHATDSTLDRGADDSTNWSGDPVTFMKAVHCSAGNALSLCRKRMSKYGDACATNK